MELSRSTVVLFVFLMIMAIGAIFVARQFRSRLTSPAGLRVASEQRLKNLHTAMLAYHTDHQAWPDSRLSLMRDRHLSIGAAAGIAYQAPAAAAPLETVVFWREQILPGAAIGEPWAGSDKPATIAMPAIGHAMTLGGELLRIPENEFSQRTAEWSGATQVNPAISPAESPAELPAESPASPATAE